MSDSIKHVLLVEDDSLLSEMYEMILKEAGFKVSLAKDGLAALRADLDEVDLVLLDIRIPEVDGLEVLEKYRARGYRKPIVILTNSPQIDSSGAKELGADDFLVKSHSEITDILRTVNKYLA